MAQPNTMPAAAAPSAPLVIGFDSEVELTLHSAFLPTARLLQCDPVARVSILTTHRTTSMRSAGARVPTTSIVSHERLVASTRRLYFTSRPAFNETLRFTVPHGESYTPAMMDPHRAAKKSSDESNAGSEEERCVEQRIRITLEDASGASLGQATCPFMPHVPSCSGGPALPPQSAPGTTTQQQQQQQQQLVRVMLQPRNAHDRRDPLFAADVATLGQHGVDDFGFILISWRVALVPHGGALMAQPQSPLTVSPPAFPVGLVLRATWLVPRRTYHRGTHYTTSVEFGGQDRFLFDGANPLFLTIQNATQLERAVVHCTLQNVVSHVDSHDVSVALPVPPMAPFAMDRDVWWTSPVRTSRGVDLGLLFASLRLVRRPLDGSAPMCSDDRCPRINDPAHQAECAHVSRDMGRAPPDTPPGAYQPIFWEGEQHIARATERRWKRDCLVEARPSVEHVRHLFDVLTGRAALDAGVARVVSVFFNQPATTVPASDLRQLLIGCAFYADGILPTEAARFCFFALRRDMEQAITREDVVFLLEHALVGRTVEMPFAEIRRRVTDTFGDTTYVLFDDFMRYFVHNYAMWYAFGIPVSVGSDEQTPNAAAVLDLSTTLRDLAGAKTVLDGNKATAAAAAPVTIATTTTGIGMGMGMSGKAAAAVDGGEDVWRTFVARVQHSHKAFSVTAHVSDTVSDVMAMVQNSTGIRAVCQEWRLAGAVLDPRTAIGATQLGCGPQQQELTIIARDEAVRLMMVYREKGLRWEIRLPASEKVLRLRALVQQRTMIPLSRCVLRARGTCMVDRHQVAHYQLQNGDTVDIAQE